MAKDINFQATQANNNIFNAPVSLRPIIYNFPDITFTGTYRLDMSTLNVGAVIGIYNTNIYGQLGYITNSALEIKVYVNGKYIGTKTFANNNIISGFAQTKTWSYVTASGFWLQGDRYLTFNPSTFFNTETFDKKELDITFECSYWSLYHSDAFTTTFCTAIGNGTDSTKAILNSPPSCVYTQPSDISGNPDWIQGMSVARVPISNATARYGGNINEIKLIVGTNSASISGNGNIDVPILDSGTLTPQIVVTDSRGQTTSYTLNPIMVMAYQKPSIESIELERHIPLGEQDETQVYINATIKQTPITDNSMGVPEVLVGGNDISDEIVWYNEPTHETVYNSTTAASKNIYGIVDDSEVFATGSTYNFTLSISDAFSTSESKTEILPTIFITMDFQALGKEIAFGTKADDDVTEYDNGLFKCGMSILNLPMIGEIKMWAGRNVPTGWLLCDGSEVRKSDYPYLYESIGDIWGIASSSDTFVLPNFCGRIAAGYDPNDTDTSESFALGSYGGSRGAWRHAHSWSKLGAGYGFAMMNTGTFKIGTSSTTRQNYIENYTPVGIENAGSSNNTIVADKANMPPYAVVKYIICAY